MNQVNECYSIVSPVTCMHLSNVSKFVSLFRLQENENFDNTHFKRPQQSLKLLGLTHLKHTLEI